MKRTGAVLPPDADWGLLLEWLMRARGYEYPRHLAQSLGFSRQTMAAWVEGRAVPSMAHRRYLTLEVQDALRSSKGETPMAVLDQIDRAERPELVPA